MKTFVVSCCVALATLLSSVAHANEFADLRVKATAARESLVTMLVNKDKRGPDHQKVVKETADAVSATLSKMKAPRARKPR